MVVYIYKDIAWELSFHPPIPLLPRPCGVGEGEEGTDGAGEGEGGRDGVGKGGGREGWREVEEGRDGRRRGRDRVEEGEERDKYWRNGRGAE